MWVPIIAMGLIWSGLVLQEVLRGQQQQLPQQLTFYAYILLSWRYFGTYTFEYICSVRHYSLLLWLLEANQGKLRWELILRVVVQSIFINSWIVSNWGYLADFEARNRSPCKLVVVLDVQKCFFPSRSTHLPIDTVHLKYSVITLLG